MNSKLLGIIIIAIILSSTFAFINFKNQHSINAEKEITATQYEKMLGVGINVDWMDFKKVNKYYFLWRSKGINVPSYFKKEGFTNVRIRVGNNILNNRTALIQLSEIINDTLKANLIPIITYTAPDLRNNPTGLQAQKHFINWWKYIATYFKNYNHLLSYELIIETSGAIKNYP